MNRFLQKIISATFLLLICFTANAQSNAAPEELMRSNGKIYVVVAVCLTILLGLFFYVFSIDRKLTKLEKEQH
jgi:CcmD family protein